MKFNAVMFVWLALFPLLNLFANGCARTAALSYYQLVAENRTMTSNKNAPELLVGLKPVRLPEYLDRPQIVTRIGENRLHVSESHRWVESLASNIAWVLAENLTALRGGKAVLVFPWSTGVKPDRQIAVELINFENEGLAAVILKARWRVYGAGGEPLTEERFSVHRYALAGPGAEQLVIALNAALAGFSRELAAEL